MNELMEYVQLSTRLRITVEKLQAKNQEQAATIQQLLDAVAGYERDMNEINALATDDSTPERIRLQVIWYKSVFSPDEPLQEHGNE